MLVRFIDDEIFINENYFFRFELEAYPFLFKEKVYVKILFLTCGLTSKE